MYLEQALAYCKYWLVPRRFHDITIQTIVVVTGDSDDEEWVWKHNRLAREFREHPIRYRYFWRENEEYYKEAVKEQAERMIFNARPSAALECLLAFISSHNASKAATSSKRASPSDSE